MFKKWKALFLQNRNHVMETQTGHEMEDGNGGGGDKEEYEYEEGG
jgi:hypothetical protein